MKKKKIILLGILTFLFATFTVSATTIKIPNTTIDDYYELNWKQTLLATEINSKLREHYDNSFPSYYGGIYITDDSKNVVLQIVEENLPAEGTEDFEFYKKIINSNPSLVIENVNNSFKDLEELNDFVSEYFVSDKDEFKNITSNSIDVKNNKVKIALEKNTSTKQNALSNTIKMSRANIDLNMVDFVQESRATMLANINPGQQVSFLSNNCSAGFRIKYFGKDSYVSAGHCVTLANESIQTGTVALSQFADNKPYDYAIVQVNSGYTPTNTLQYPSGNVTKLAVVNYCPEMVVGTVIAKSGKTTYYTSGKITELSATARYRITETIYVTITKLVKSQVNAAKGDSGAPVFIPRSDSNGGAIPVGVLSGGDGSIMYFTNINNIPQATNRY